MNEIKIIQHEDDRIEVYINGNGKILSEMLASAIENDPNFGTLILTAIVMVAEKQPRFPNINPN